MGAIKNRLQQKICLSKLTGILRKKQSNIQLINQLIQKRKQKHFHHQKTQVIRQHEIQAEGEEAGEN